MDAAALLRGFVAGLAATGVAMAVQALAWARWGQRSVFEWTEAQAGIERLVGRRSFRGMLAANGLIGGVAGTIFVAGAVFVPIAPRVVLGSAYGFLMWVVTLLIHRRVTGEPARGVGVAVSLATHLIYGSLLGAWSA